MLADLRLARRLAALLGLLIVCVPLHYLWLAVRGRSPWPPRFLGWAARACGARARVVGKPLRHDVFFVSNHQSWLDILILGGATGSAFIAKAELATVPLVGWLCSLNRTVYVRRDDRRAMPEQIETVRRALGRGAVTIFAEGTTSDGTELLPFKAGLLQVLDPPPPGLRVQPLFLDYGADAPAIGWAGKEPGQVNALRILRRRGSVRVAVHCLEPFDPAACGDRKAIAAEARRRITAAIAASGSAVRVV